MQSESAKDFATNITKMIEAKCNIIITVGFMLGDATRAAAKANPNVHPPSSTGTTPPRPRA